ncbi:DNA polymerase IV [Paenibacillus senegalensis]|uniref:DNA polymerase IV n=1 Tax=Paenibacillus senegalensis TaxID=1465766 RepID=UPI0002E5BCD5|nr:DNA polymerase IV [Paenibacillus senegalensis]
MKQARDSYPSKGRVILHVDMNAFYCSVHQAAEPEKYADKAIAVAGSVELRKGIVVTSSYEARKKGVKTGMLVSQALRVCPELVLIRPDFDLYRQFSRRFIKLAYSYSPLVETMSIDECYVDITGSHQFGTPLEIATHLQDRIARELSLPCSIGIAPNKLLAKMASDMKKPNGITILRLRDVPGVLWPRPCKELFGIGSKTAAKLSKLNIRTIGELAHTPEDFLIKEFGVWGSWLHMAANGIDRSPVNPEKEQSKSVGHTTTLPYNYTELDDIKRVFLNLADQTSRRLRRQGLICSTVQIVIRDPDMKTITRALTLSRPTQDPREIHQHACKLFEHHWPLGKPVRLLGITLQNLKPRDQAPIQLDLFEVEEFGRKEQLIRAMDEIRDKFGDEALLTAGMLGNDPSALIRNHKIRGTSLQTDFLRDRNHEDGQE